MYISKALGICFLTFSKELPKINSWESISHTNICLKTLLKELKIFNLAQVLLQIMEKLSECISCTFHLLQTTATKILFIKPPLHLPYHVTLSLNQGDILMQER